jgi:hypothetical protein
MPAAVVATTTLSGLYPSTTTNCLVTPYALKTTNY